MCVFQTEEAVVEELLIAEEPIAEVSPDVHLFKIKVYFLSLKAKMNNDTNYTIT